MEAAPETLLAMPTTRLSQAQRVELTGLALVGWQKVMGTDDGSWGCQRVSILYFIFLYKGVPKRDQKKKAVSGFCVFVSGY